MHDDVTGVLPVLDGEVLDLDVTRSLGGHTSVDHVNGRLVILVDGGRLGLGESEFLHNRPDVSGLLGCGDSGEEFGLSSFIDNNIR